MSVNVPGFLHRNRRVKMVLQSSRDSIDLEYAVLCERPLVVRSDDVTPATAPVGMVVEVIATDGVRFRGSVVHVKVDSCPCQEPVHIGVMLR